MPAPDTAHLPTALRDAAARLGDALQQRALYCATAESCTGGLLGSALTSVPGASAWFAGGVIAYANKVKEHVLAVPADTLRVHGAVSEPVVLAMARGVCQGLDVPVGVSISGIAGPAGGTPQKPVGLVWIGFCVNTVVTADRNIFAGSRDAVRLHAALAAIHGLLRRL